MAHDKVEKESHPGVSTELHSLSKGKEKVEEALANEIFHRRFRQQLYALFVKRALVYRRDISGLIVTLIFPVAVISAIATVSRMRQCILLTH